MDKLIYSFFILLFLLATKQENLIHWKVLLFLAIILCFCKRLWKYLCIGLTLGFVLNPNFKKPILKASMYGKVIRSLPKYFIIKNGKDNVFVWSNANPKTNQYLKVRGTPKYWAKEDIYGFNARNYWMQKNVNYKLNNAVIKSKYTKAAKLTYNQSWFNFAFRNIKDDITNPIYDNLKELNLAHIIVISSFHIGFIYATFKYFFGKVIAFLILFAFCYYIKFPIPTLKALVFIIIYELFKTKNSKIGILALTGIIILIYKPTLSTSTSLHLTIGFSLLLMLMTKNKAFLSQIFILRTWGIYVNWIFSKAFYPLNYLTLLLSPTIFIVYFAILFRIDSILKLFEKIISLINKFNIPMAIGYSKWLAFIIFLLLIMLSANLTLVTKSSKKVFLTLFSIFIFNKIYLYNSSFVSYINVGQGDASLIKLKNKAYLIDCGTTKAFNKIVKPYLFSYGINFVDNLYISHNHIDHNGCLQGSWKGLKLKNKKSNKFINLNKSWPEENNNSLVLLFKYNNKTFLFTGDIEAKAEMWLTKKYYMHIDYLKVAHHGSKTSTSLEFLKSFNPKNAIISTGKNRHGHPHDDVLYRLKDYGTKVHITKNDKTIKVGL